MPGVTAVKAGGHFDGSLVLHWEKKLFVADTLMAVPVRLAPIFTYLPFLSPSPTNLSPTRTIL